MQALNDRMKAMDMRGGLYEIFQLASDMEARGAQIIHMEIGKPDFDSPQIAKAALIKSLNEGFVHYTQMAGIAPLREAIAEKEKRKNGIAFDPETEIIVTAGACEALMAFMLTVLNPDDEILIPAPYFSAYADMAQIAGVNIKEVPLRFAEQFALKAEDLEKAVTAKTKALLINTPHNPTGAVITEEELKRIANFAIRHDLFVVSDETYDRFRFEGAHTSIYTLPGMKERTMVINSASKTFSMTGWRVGYAIAQKDTIAYMNKVHQNMSTCATSFVQVGVTEAFRQGDAFTENMVEEFKKRRDILAEGLSQIAGIDVVVPKGAFYLFPRIQRLGVSARVFCKKLLEETGVAAVPGDAFGQAGEGFIRLAYACSEQEILLAVERIKEFVEKYFVAMS